VGGLADGDVAEEAAWAAALAGGFGFVRSQLGIAGDAETVEHLAANYTNQALEVAIDTINERPDWLRQRGRDPNKEQGAWARALPLLHAALGSSVDPDRPCSPRAHSVSASTSHHAGQGFESVFRLQAHRPDSRVTRTRSPCYLRSPCCLHEHPNRPVRALDTCRRGRVRE
jgi:hypothetical protein